MPARALQPYVIAEVVDETESRTEMRLFVRRTTGRDAGMAAAQLLAELVDSASSCAAVGAELHYAVQIQPPAAPAPGGDLRGFGVLVFATTEPDQYAIIEIPGLTADLRDPLEPNTLLLAAPALQSYINALIDGVFCNPFGYNLIECIAGLYELRQ